MSRCLTIVGSSARAAAFSAVRAGFFVRAADQFADADLRRMAQATRVDNYPKGLAGVLQEAQPGPWLYTGGLENRPGLVRAWARHRQLWGNGADVLRRVRDPLRLANELSAAGVQTLATRRTPQGLPLDGSWLRKPLRSAGGLNIQAWDPQAAAQAPAGPVYFQQRVEGTACSAAYVACQGRAVLLGVTRQWVGEPWTGAAPWHYCGSVGPWPVSPAVRGQLQQLGSVLATWGQLEGLFGVDLVINAQGIWPIELNPRYTASMEVLERAGQFSAIALHAAACQHQRSPADSFAESAYVEDAWFGKAIWYTHQRIEFANRLAALVREELASADDWPRLADLPEADSEFSPGWPVLTAFASGNSADSVRYQLSDTIDRLRAAAGRQY